MLKSLIALTCVVIIATAGYWVWGDQQAKAAMAQAAASRAQAQALASIRDACMAALDNAAKFGKDKYLTVLEGCLAEGSISGTDVEAAVAQQKQASN